MFDNLTKFIVLDPAHQHGRGSGHRRRDPARRRATDPAHPDLVDQHDHRGRARPHARLRTQRTGHRAAATPRPAQGPCSPPHSSCGSCSSRLCSWAATWWLFHWDLAHGAQASPKPAPPRSTSSSPSRSPTSSSCRSLTGPAWRVGLFSNRWIVGGVTVQAIGQLAPTYLPTMNHLFHTAPISGEAWMRILALAASSVGRGRRRQAPAPGRALSFAGFYLTENPGVRWSPCTRLRTAAGPSRPNGNPPSARSGSPTTRARRWARTTSSRSSPQASPPPRDISSTTRCSTAAAKPRAPPAPPRSTSTRPTPGRPRARSGSTRASRTSSRAGHLRGSLNVPADGRFAETASMVMAQEVVLVAPQDREEELTVRLGRIRLRPRRRLPARARGGLPHRFGPG